MQASREEQTSADRTQIGFEYQYLCFIKLLLQMRAGEEVGYECHDDLHILSSDGATQYIQVKHTMQKNSKGETPNLSEKSDEFWKTMSNWSELITDKEANRELVTDQKTFLSKSKFIFLTNRKIKKNRITDLLKGVQNENLGVSEILNLLKDIRQTTKRKELMNYIQNIESLDKTVLLLLFKNTSIRNESSDIYNEIRKLIRGKMVSDDLVDSILNDLYSKLKEEFFQLVVNRKHQVLTYDEWIKKYTPIFNQYRRTLLPRIKNTWEMPDDLSDNFFVKELEDIGVIEKGEKGKETIFELARYLFIAKMNYAHWYNEGYLTRNQLSDFHRNNIRIWKNIHTRCHRETKNNLSLDNENALKCYDSTMEKELKLINESLSIEESNGEFLSLCNEKDIGWRYKWKEFC